MRADDLDLHAASLLYGGAAHGAWGHLMIALTIVGNGWLALCLAPLLVSARSRRFAGTLALALAAQALAVWAIKRAVGRVRPWIALGWCAPIDVPRDPSFPSGHAAGAFCAAAFIALTLPVAWPGRPWRCRLATVTATVVAALIAYSRVYLGAHFPTDVLAGALLGSAIGALSSRLFLAGGRAEHEPHSVPRSGPLG